MRLAGVRSTLTRIGFGRFLLVTTVCTAPATFVTSSLGERAPRYVNALLVIFGVFVAAVARRRRKPG